MNGQLEFSTRIGGELMSNATTQKNTGESVIGMDGPGALGSFSKSRQQSPFPFPSQLGQHFGFSESEFSVVAQPGRKVAFSIKQIRNDGATVGTRRTMQSNRMVAVKRRITEIDCGYGMRGEANKVRSGASVLRAGVGGRGKFEFPRLSDCIRRRRRCLRSPSLRG